MFAQNRSFTLIACNMLSKKSAYGSIHHQQSADEIETFPASTSRPYVQMRTIDEFNDNCNTVSVSNQGGRGHLDVRTKTTIGLRAWALVLWVTTECSQGRLNCPPVEILSTMCKWKSRRLDAISFASRRLPEILFVNIRAYKVQFNVLCYQKVTIPLLKFDTTSKTITTNGTRMCIQFTHFPIASCFASTTFK